LVSDELGALVAILVIVVVGVVVINGISSLF